MIVFFPLILVAAATPAATPAAPVKCDAKPFTLTKPTPAGKAAAAKGQKPKAEPPRPIEKPSCNHPDHGQPGHKH